MEIRHLKNEEINLVKWDNCINTAFNGNIFAFSWFLNIMCEEWEALVINDYEYVFPILFQKSHGKKLVCNPILSNRLGVFSNSLLTPNITQSFIDYLKDHYDHIRIRFNKFNNLPKNNAGSERGKVYELDLIQSYNKISEEYSPVLQKELNIAHANKISVMKGLMPNEVIDFASSVRNKQPKLKAKDFNKLRMIISFALRFRLGDLYGAYDEHNNLCAVAFFMESKRKTHLIFNAVNPVGLQYHALEYIVDRYIEEKSELNLTLNLERVACKDELIFYQGFGAREYSYLKLEIDNLPWYHPKKAAL